MRAASPRRRLEVTARDEVFWEGHAPFRIAVVSDTHSRPDPRAANLIEKLRPSLLLHAGDIGDLEVLEPLSKLSPRFMPVVGNIDGVRHDIPEVRVIDVVRASGPALTIVLTHIAVYGPRLLPAVRSLAKRLGAGLVVCGHSHVPLAAVDSGVAVFNPGSIGPRRFHLPITFGLIELGERLVLRHIDCETGLFWTPPAP